MVKRELLDGEAKAFFILLFSLNSNFFPPFFSPVPILYQGVREKKGIELGLDSYHPILINWT